ncbi:MAG: 30S ribosomal protein S13 [Candidatus Nitrosocaldaceae archaeon]|nr:MAG: 30S ribosomal protein S13 [Candidatus Nitrosocaldaceae archaeon]
MSEQEFRHIVRIAGKDVDGSKKLVVALSEIRGIGYNLAQLLLQQLNIDPNTRTGYVKEEDVANIEEALKDPTRVNIPVWYLNRRKDIETGKDIHLITSDLDMTLRNDLEREKVTQSWRGIRHMYGLKVRGQRTRTTGRRRGGTIGVRKGGKVGPK